MAGFLSASTSLLICESEQKISLPLDKLRAGAFSEAIDADDKRSGWVSLGEVLDVDNFSLANCDGRFSGFSYRLDSRKAAAALVRLRLAEQIRAAEMDGGRLGARARRELKEKITEEITMSSPFIPSLTDCVWDSLMGRLFISSTSEKLVERILAHFHGSFGIDARPIMPEKDMSAQFAQIHGKGARILNFDVQSMGSAVLTTMAGNNEKQEVTTRNSVEAISEALNNGLAISRMALVANGGEDREYYFTLDANLAIANLRLPKAEKGADKEGSFLVNAELLSTVASLVDELAKND